MNTFLPLQSVVFTTEGDDPKRPQWNVAIQEDGTLRVIAIGRRPGAILVESRSNCSVGITSSEIVRREVQNS
jgi:hypothetical protein